MLDASGKLGSFPRPMPTCRHTEPIFRRVLAGAAVAVVFALTVFAASPALHAWLHHDATPQADDCAVVLFASGVTLAVGAAVVLAPRVAWREFVPVAVAGLHLVAPRHLRPPECGPPVR